MKDKYGRRLKIKDRVVIKDDSISPKGQHIFVIIGKDEITREEWYGTRITTKGKLSWFDDIEKIPKHKCEIDKIKKKR